MSDDAGHETELAREWDDRADGPADTERVTPRVVPTPGRPSLAATVNEFLWEHRFIAFVVAVAITVLLVVGGDAAFGKHGIWIAIGVLAALICLSGGFLWNRAITNGDADKISVYRRQTLGGVLFVVLIAIRIATQTY